MIQNPFQNWLSNCEQFGACWAVFGFQQWIRDGRELRAEGKQKEKPARAR
jgi:hypothetical protein